MKNSDSGRQTGLRRFSTLLLLLLLVSALLPGSAEEGGKRHVRVGCFPMQGFFNFAADGSVSGYGADYTNAVASHAGWEVEYVRYPSWVDALEAFSRNEIDLLTPAQRTAERDALYSFDSLPIGTEYGALLALSTNESLIYEDFAAFDGIRVGCVRELVFASEFAEYAGRNGFQVQMSAYRDTPALLAALRTGEVDAIVANLMVRTDSMKLLGKFGAAPFYYMLHREDDALRAELNQVVDRLTSQHPEFQNELTKLYFSEFDRLPLSREELDFIADCGTLRVACGGQYAPFSYLDAKSGHIAGVDREVFDRVAELTGLQFEYLAIPFEGDVQAFLQDNEIALVAGVENDAQTVQLHDHHFTESYIQVSKYFYGLSGTEPDADTPMTVAVLSAVDAQVAVWQELHPNYTFERFDSVSDCLAALHSGAAQLMLEDRYSMERVLAAPRNKGIEIMPTASIESRICCRVLSGGDEERDEMLISILNKAFRQITSAELELIVSDCTQANRYVYGLPDFLYQYRLPILFGAGALLVALAALLMVLLARGRAQRLVAENEMKLRNITNNINGGVIVLRANEGLEITYANDGFLELIGCAREEFKQGSYLAYVHPDDLDKIQSAIESVQNEVSMELRVKKSDDSYLPALFNGTAAERGGERELYCVIMDMSRQNQLMDQLRIENRRTELILERVEEIFYEVDLEARSIATSGSFQEKLGWTLPRELPRDSIECFDRIWRSMPEDVARLAASTREMLKKGEPVSTVVRLEKGRCKDFVWCEVLQHPIFANDGRMVKIIGLIRDVDEQINERERLIEQAQRDPLTSLYNKDAFETKVVEALEKQPGQNHALVFVDLDHFKTLNDTLGHMAGDRAICDAADKLKIIFSNYDILSRFGGDEFCIFVKNIPLDTLRGKMDWLVEKLHQDYSGPRGSVRISCSCGVACTQESGFDYTLLMQNADRAMYCAKESGRDRYTFYQR